MHVFGIRPQTIYLFLLSVYFRTCNSLMLGGWMCNCTRGVSRSNLFICIIQITNQIWAKIRFTIVEWIIGSEHSLQPSIYFLLSFFHEFNHKFMRTLGVNVLLLILYDQTRTLARTLTRTLTRMWYLTLTLTQGVQHGDFPTLRHKDAPIYVYFHECMQIFDLLTHSLIF